MILFEEDWNKYPSAIADTSTTNTSWIEICALYRDMGIKNHLFPLTLLTPSLVGVDPYNPKNDIEAAKIVIECRLNPWYFFREVVRDPKLPSSKLRANRGNIALYWLFFNHITTVLVQIRQTGKTFSIIALDAYLMSVRCMFTTMLMLTRGDGLRAKTLAELKNQIESLPYYLNTKKKSDPANTETLIISLLNNTYVGLVAQASVLAAESVGRGYVSPKMFVDEFAYIKNIATSLPAMLAAGNAARDSAAANNEPYGTVMATTTGKLDDPDGAYAHKIWTNSAVWSEKFLDCANITVLKETVTKNSPNAELRVNCTFNHRQLGYPDSWLAEKIREIAPDSEALARDLLNKWTRGSSSSPLTTEELNTVQESLCEPIGQEITRNGYVIRWHIDHTKVKEIAANTFFVLGGDTSDAIGNDATAIVITDIRTGGTVASASFNETNLINICIWLVDMFVNIDNLVAVIERRSSGAMILDYLLKALPEHGIDPFKRLYNKVVDNHTEFDLYYNEVKKPLHLRSTELYDKCKKYFGYTTSASGENSRKLLYSSVLKNAIKNAGSVIKDQVIVGEILGLMIKNGRVDHADGCHDDSCVAWLLSHWLIGHGKNLSFYGIPSNIVMVDNKVMSKEKKNTPIVKASDIVNNKLIAESANLMSELDAEKDPFRIQQLTFRLQVLGSRIKQTDTNYVSIDKYLEDLKTRKKQSNRSQNQYSWH